MIFCRQQRLDAATWRGSSSSAVHKTAACQKKTKNRHRSPGTRLQLRCRSQKSNGTTTMVHTTIMIGAEVVGILSSGRVKLLPRPTPDEILALIKHFNQKHMLREVHQTNLNVENISWSGNPGFRRPYKRKDLGCEFTFITSASVVKYLLWRARQKWSLKSQFTLTWNSPHSKIEWRRQPSASGNISRGMILWRQ